MTDEALASLVQRVQESALALAAGAPTRPRAVRVRAGDVSVELEWASEGPTGTIVAIEQQDVATTAALAGPAEVDPPGRAYVTASTVGVFYRAPEPGAPPFVDVGDTIVKGQQVGIIEAMKLMIPVEADAAGCVVEVLVDDGAAVEFADRIFAVALGDT
jgi:acetyl-CoA carboxylase biotin carboxyl carrier protein